MQILIVDDQARARQSLMALLATWFQYAVVHEAVNGVEAVACLERLNGASAARAMDKLLVVTDARMNEMDGVELTRLIKTRWPRIGVIVLSMYDEYRVAALAAGADAFVSKDEPLGKLYETLKRLMENGVAHVK